MRNTHLFSSRGLVSNCQFSYAGYTRWATALLLCAILAHHSLVYAIPIEGDPRCSLEATVTAEPTEIDRWSPQWTSTPTTTVTWSVETSDCANVPRLTLDGFQVGAAGSKMVAVQRSRTFDLEAPSLLATLASATVHVTGDPGLIEVSEGAAITPHDLEEFNAQWMQPYQLRERWNSTWWPVFYRFDAGVWGIGASLAALASMYERTGGQQYVTHLKDLLDLVLSFRDDHHPGGGEDHPEIPPTPIDDIRRVIMPAWGGKSVNSGNLHHTSEVVASFYSYPIAAFARIVAEDPRLHKEYGRDAVRYTNEVLHTVQAFLPQIETRRVGNFTEAYLTHIQAYRQTPTASQCQDAYDRERKALGAHPDGHTLDRLKTMRRNCNNLKKMAGKPFSHNENLAFAMVLIELFRALDSEWYRQSPEKVPDADEARATFPQLVSRLHRYFYNQLQVKPGDSYYWHYADNIPDDLCCHAEDINHGALDMRYLEVLRKNYDRLNPIVAKIGEPIALDPTIVNRFANTFLNKIAAGHDLARNIDGAAQKYADKGLNSECDGWVNLTVANSEVFRRCRDVTLREVGGGQPYLTIGNHAALLANKRWLRSDPSPQPHPDPVPPPPPAPKQCRSNQKCCESSPDGGCSFCIPRNAQCQ